MRIAITCSVCGGNRLDFPGADEAVVKCEECGHALGTLEDIKDHVRNVVLRQAGRD